MADKASKKKGGSSSGGREVELEAKPRKENERLLSSIFYQTFALIRLILLDFLDALGVCSCCLILDLKGNSLIFLPLSSN